MEPGVEAYEAAMAEPMVEIADVDELADAADVPAERPERPTGRPSLKVVK